MRVIFSGDDFGLTSGINKGIILAFKQGVLTSTSLVISGEAAEEAISLAKENPSLDMGIHLILCDEPSVLPPEYLSSIMSLGSSFPSRGKILSAILARKIDYNQVEAEWSSQIEKGLNAGIPINHLDSHQFIHLFPGLFSLFLRLAAKYKIPYVRTSIFDLMSLEVGIRRLLQWNSLRLWIRFYVSRRRSSHVRSPPSIGFLKAGGRMERDTILRTIDRIKRKQLCPVVEVILHPGIGDAHTAHKYKHWHYNWNKDLELLQDHSLAEALNHRGVLLTSFKELA